MTAPTRRPKFLPGTIEAVKEKSTPLGFDTVTCFFCKVTVLNAEFVAHHEVPWCVIENIVANDYEMQIAPEDGREEMLRYLHSYLDNLHGVHGNCNSADGNIWRDYQAHCRIADVAIPMLERLWAQMPYTRWKTQELRRKTIATLRAEVSLARSSSRSIKLVSSRIVLMNIAQAKAIPLQDWFARLGVEYAEADRRNKGSQRWYKAPWRDEKTASLHMDTARNIWYDFGMGNGNGGDIIDFAKALWHLSNTRDALHELDRAWGGVARPTVRRAAAPKVEEPRDPITIERVQALEHPALIGRLMVGRDRQEFREGGYLPSRGIPLEVAAPYVKEIHYRIGDRQYFALGFPNDGGGYELRSPYFKGCYGQKSPSTIQFDNHGGDTAIFEGFIDFLSAVTLGLLPEACTRVLVLNSTKMIERALNPRYFGDGAIHLYLDNNESGRLSTQYFCARMADYAVLDQSGIYAGHEDLNDMLKARLPGLAR